MVTVSGYQNIQPLHSGKQSNLFRAIESATSTPVILKTQAQAQPSFADLRQLQQEFAFSQLINHSSVIHYKAFIPESEKIFLVIEDFGATSLTTCIPKTGMEVVRFLHIGEQLLSGVQAIHAQKLMHNALNPQNIVLNGNTDVVKIIDFGKASQIALPSYRLGSLVADAEMDIYLAPEQIDSSCPADHRADLYALGMIFYELLTGRRPLLKTELNSDSLKPPHQIRSSIPTMLSQLIMKMMHPNIDARYQDCAPVLADLMRCKNDLQEYGRISDFQLNRQTNQTDTTTLDHPDEKELNRILTIAQTLANEVDLHRLLKKLMHLILEHSNTQICHLILQSNENLRIAASVKTKQNDVEITQPMSIPTEDELAQTVVLNTLQTGYLTHFAADSNHENGRWQTDRYLQKNPETTVLCLPVQHKENRIGVLYVEKNQAGAVFNKKDIEILQFLANQTAISLENAFLYEDATQTLIKHKRAEKKLKSIDERLKVAMEAGTLGIWDWEIATNTITWSDYVEKLFGMEKGEFDGSYKTYTSLIHPDDLVIIEENIAKALSDPNFSYQVTHRLIWPNGEVHWLEGTGQVYRDEQNNPVHMTGYVMDITERKVQEHAKQEREAWLERVLELGKNITAVTDWDQCLKTLHYCVQTGLEFERAGIFIYNPKTHLVRGAYGTGSTGKIEETSWFVQDIREDPGFYTVLSSPKGFQYYENLSNSIERDEDHEMYGVSEHATVAVWAGDYPIGAIAVDNGITHKRIKTPQLEALRLFASYAGFALENARLLDQLSQQKGQLQLALNAAQMGTWDWDLVTDNVSWTEQVAILHGFPAEKSTQLEKREIWSTAHPNDKAELIKIIDKVAKENETTFRFEYRVPHNGSTNVRWLEIMGKRINDEHGRPIRISGTVIDITARKQAENEREQLIEELESRNAELERFTYTVSHDLKSPLITIRGFLGLLERDIERNDQVKVARDMERIHAAAGRMLTLLDDLLELSRIGRLTNPPVAVSINELAATAIELVTGRIQEQNVSLVVQPDCPTVFVDKPRLIEVFQNLIDNAVKFMGEQPTPVIEIGAYVTETEIVCFVKDNGVGIEPRYLDRIFNLFERLDPSIDGTGIGLALIKRIVEFHNGRIWAESEGQGKGTTFLFTLPPVTSISSMYE